ncbi:DUF5658 family protein [Alteribacter lacisalsi]
MLAAIAVLNLTDAILTIIGLHYDVIREANPLMA